MGTCLFCNQPLIQNNKGRKRKYCNETCRGRKRSKEKLKPKNEKHNKEKRKVTLLACVECCSMFESRGGVAKYCGIECKRNAEKKRKPTFLKICEQCKTEFETKTKQAKFCSSTCVGNYQREQAIQNNYYSIPRHIFPNRHARREYRRRKRIRENWVEFVDLKILIERDKGICQLCNKPVRLDILYSEALAPTTDHIIPVSKGGEHSYANCQLAHRKCNTFKNDRLEVNSNGKTKQKREGTSSEVTN